MLFGYAVTGVINPHRVWRNVGARAGDVLLFNETPWHRRYYNRVEKKIAPRRNRLLPAVTAMNDPESRFHSRAAGLDEMTACAKRIHAVTTLRAQPSRPRARKWRLAIRRTVIEQVSFEIDHKAFAYFPGAVGSCSRRPSLRRAEE